MKGLYSKIEEAKKLLNSFKNTDSEKVEHLKEIMNDLQTSDANDSSLFENSILNDLKYGIWSVSVDFKDFFYVNPSVIQITEYTKSEFQANPKLIKEIIHPEDLNILKEAEKEFLITGKSISEFRILTKSNKLKWIEFKQVLIKNQDEIPIRVDGVIKDVSNKKSVIEKELKRGGDILLHQEILFKLSCLGAEYSFEKKQELLVKNTAKVLNVEWLGIWMFNHSKTLLKSKFRYSLSQDKFENDKQLSELDYPIYFNRLKKLEEEKYLVINDVSKEDFTSKLMVEHLDNIGITSMLLMPIKRDNKLVGVITISNVGEARNWTQEEESFAASIANILSIYIESEEKRIIGKALMEKTKVLLEAQHVAKIGNYIIDLNTGEWKSSVVFDQVFGIDRLNYKKDVKNWIKLISPEYSEYVFDVFKEVVRQKKLHVKHRFDESFKIIRQNDGEERWVSVLGEFQYDENGIPTHMLGTMQDITERKVIEFELIEAKELAESLLQTKANFLSNMSHEIRTPLNGIIGFTSLLQDSNLNEDQKEMVQAIDNSGKNLLVIVNDILDFSKMEAQKMVFESIPFDLVETLKNTLHLMVLKCQEKGVELIYSIDDNISTKLIGDPNRLNQILNNLVGNAVKFTEQGFVELNLTLLEDSEEEVSIDFSVVDSGIGIESDKLNVIFESFSQASNNTTRIFGGSGLGLAITKKLVELQKGELKVYSQVGVGSNFSFSLNFKKQINISDENEESTSNQIEYSFLKGFRILLAEDIDINRKLIKRIFEKWETTIDIAHDGQEALEMALETNYDLILMDLQMPVMDGLTSAERILRKKELPILALTAYTSKEYEEKCLSVGMKCLLTKPINQEVLLNTLYKFLVNKDYQVEKMEEVKEISSKQKDKLINFEYLDKVTGGDEEFKKEMVDLVAVQLPKMTLKISNFSKEGNALELKKSIHKLKSTIGVLGLDKGKKLIIEMEKTLAQSNSVSDVTFELELLLEMCENLQQEIKELDF